MSFNWGDYHALNRFTPPDFPKVSSEYIYTYPINWRQLDVLEIWKEKGKYYYPKAYSIYIHFPFCREMCSFCTFCHEPFRRDHALTYGEALIKELDLYAHHSNIRDLIIESVYFGGGTPCLMSPDVLTKILQTIRARFCFDKDLEITVECNPTDVSQERLKCLLDADVNRVSFGIQAFSNRLTDALRIKPREKQGILAVDLALKVGFENICIDLMYGIPGQTAKDFINEIDIAVELGVNGISIYWLDIEGSRLETYVPNPSPAETAKELYYSGRARLLEHEFTQQSQPDFYKKTRCVYEDTAWKATQGGVISFGAGAITYFFNGFTYVNSNKVNEYVQLVNQEIFPVIGGVKVEKKQLMEKYPILGFRCLNIHKEPFNRQFGKDFSLVFRSKLDKLKV